MKSSLLDSYCAVGKTTSEFPLSAHVIMAPWTLVFTLTLISRVWFGRRQKVACGVIKNA